MLDKLTHADFEPHLHSAFTLQLDAGEALPLELTAVRASAHATPTAERRSFALTFRSALRGHLPQRIYTLTHPQLGTLEIFLVPVGPDQIGMQYEAVFN